MAVNGLFGKNLPFDSSGQKFNGFRDTSKQASAAEMALKVEQWEAADVRVGKMDQKKMACALKHVNHEGKEFAYIDTNWLPSWKVLRQPNRGDKILIRDEDQTSSELFDKLNEAEQASCEGMKTIVESLSKVNKDIDYIELDSDKHLNSNINDDEPRSAFLRLSNGVSLFKVPSTDEKVSDTAQHVNAIDHLCEEAQNTRNGNQLLSQPEGTYIRLVLAIDMAKFNPSQKHGRFVTVPVYVDQVFTAKATEDWKYKTANDEKPKKAVKVDD